MANALHVAILRQGIGPWNKWRELNPDVKPNLEGMNLQRSQFNTRRWSKVRLNRLYVRQQNMESLYDFVSHSRYIDLSETNLRNADLSWADISNCLLDYADLSAATLTGTDLSSASLRHATLDRASLEYAILNETDLAYATLIDANLESTRFISTRFENTNVSRARVGSTVFSSISIHQMIGIDTLVHTAPSTIGTDTLARSKTYLPAAFLRGCGLADILIDYLPTMVNPPIQYSSCFISYSSADEEFARKLYKDLDAKGVRCWFAPEHMKIGDKIRQSIDSAIQLKQKLLVILSENSINSEWVEMEIESAFAMEREKKRLVLFPIRIDQSILSCDKAWAATIQRMRHVGDFSLWTDDNYYALSLSRLLRDLRIVDSVTK